MTQYKKGKRFAILILFLLSGIGLNLLGRKLASSLDLPLWLDSVGTGVTACVLGPVYGCICGCAGNIFYGIFDPREFAYVLTSIAIGLVTGICMKKGMFRSLFDALTTSVLVAISVVLVSTPLNLLFVEGRPGNLWGDALFELLRNRGLPVVTASFLGELFVDFPDKVVTILITFLLLRLQSSWVKKHNKKETGKGKSPIFLIPFLTAISVLAFPSGQKYVSAAAEEIVSEYSSQYAQMIYNSENGLASGEANAIVGTKDGYLYFGTYSGLYRYDGRNFTLMRLDSVKNVNCFSVNENDRLIIGTNDSGLSVYENGRVTTVINKGNRLPSNSVRSILPDGKGNLYVGTSSYLSILTDGGDFSVKKSFTELSYVRDLALRSDGTVAAVTNAGVLGILRDEKIAATDTLAESNIHYTSCVFFKDRLFLGTSQNQVIEYDLNRMQSLQNSVIDTKNLANIHAMYEDKENNVIWLCADNGIGYLDENLSYTALNTGSFQSSIDGMAKDYQGNLWFSSSRLGALKLTKSAFSNVYYQYGMESKVVNSVVMWEGLLYIGTDLGLDVIDQEKKQPVKNELTERLLNHRIRCLMVDSRNHLFIAVSDGTGLFEVSPDGTTIIYNSQNGTIGDRFRSVKELSDGTIVAAENTGIDYIRDGKVIATVGTEDGLSNPQILTMFEKDSETLYAGSDGDGLMIIKNGKVVRRITESDGLTSGVILRIIPVKEGLFLVTSNSLCFLSETNGVTELKNFPYTNNFDVIEDDGDRLWVLGSAGIYIVRKSELLSGNELTYELLDSRKGLKSSLTANSWHYREGSLLYLCCSSGVFCIDMKNYNIYKGTYKITLEILDADNNSLFPEVKEQIELPMDTTRIKLRPELLNYTLNDPYISFCLYGYDKEEIVQKQSSLTDLVYSNLPSGEYELEVRILDSTGDLVIQSETFTIVKKPHFYENRWFKAYLIFVCILAVVYITWLFTVLRSRKVIERQKQEIELAKKQAEMGNQTILAIAKTVDAKDINTRKHSERVSEYSVLLAEQLGFSREQCENLRQIALLHDIGKVGIPDSILNKPARLTEEEYAIMKTHVTIGSDILKDFTLIKNVQDGVRYHHERYDGKGYMTGLKGEEIPKDARIIEIADAFDAMTSNRVYRRKMDVNVAIGELKKGSGTQFDPQLVEIMLSLIKDGRILVEEQPPEE